MLPPTLVSFGPLSHWERVRVRVGGPHRLSPLTPPLPMREGKIAEGDGLLMVQE
jgi:hypothetical protein